MLPLSGRDVTEKSNLTRGQIEIIIKNKIVNSWPVGRYGSSTGRAPIQVKRITVPANDQTVNL